MGAIRSVPPFGLRVYIAHACTIMYRCTRTAVPNCTQNPLAPMAIALRIKIQAGGSGCQFSCRLWPTHSRKSLMRSTPWAASHASFS